MIRVATRARILGPAAAALLLLISARTVAAAETFQGCIAEVEPQALLVKASWGEYLRLETAGFVNADGHAIAADECYQFTVERAADGRLLLSAIQPLDESDADSSQKQSEDQDRSRN